GGNFGSIGGESQQASRHIDVAWWQREGVHDRRIQYRYLIRLGRAFIRVGELDQNVIQIGFGRGIFVLAVEEGDHPPVLRRCFLIDGGDTGRRQRRRRIEGCAVLRLHRRAGGKQKRGDRSKQHSRAEPAPETGFRSSRTDDGHKKPHARAPYLGAGVPAGATCASCSCPVTSISSGFEISICGSKRVSKSTRTRTIRPFKSATAA